MISRNLLLFFHALCFLIICALCQKISLEHDHSVTVKQGVLLGKLWNFDGRKVQIFKGIPYAEPPIGERRFKKPMEKSSWRPKLLSAQQTGAACIQFMDFHMKDEFSKTSMNDSSEDCLYLNIYAPHPETSGQQFPVLVWIHGGSYLAGSGDTGIDENVTIANLVLSDIIVVAINYRLGPLGFASSEVKGLKGNFGLWDQIEALRWIKINIEKFGGNSDAITIMGESAGAASVSILALSPITKAEELVHGAIIMSGSSAAGWAVQRSGKSSYDVQNIYDYCTCKKQFNREDLAHIFRSADIDLDKSGACNLLAEKLECNAQNEQEMWECLRKADFSDPFFRKALTIELGVSKAVVDGEIIPYSIDDLLINASRLPILTGVAAAEWFHKKPKYYGLGAYKPVNETVAKEKINAIIMESLKPRLNAEPSNFTLHMLGEAAYLRYIKEESSNLEWERTNFLRRLQTLEADIEFVAPCQREAEAYANSGNAVYLYSFEHVPRTTFEEEDWAWHDLFGEKRFTKVKRKLRFELPFHGLDHAYIFNKGYTNNMNFTYDDMDRKMSALLCKLITNFVKHKNPTPSEIDGTKWHPYAKNDRRYARLRLPLTMVNSDFYRSNASFWNDFIPTMATRLLRTVEGQPKQSALTEEERIQLAAYRKAWWALWILVAAIAVVLWTIVICLVAQKCISAKSGPYKNIIVANR